MGTQGDPVTGTQSICGLDGTSQSSYTTSVAVRTHGPGVTVRVRSDMCAKRIGEDEGSGYDLKADGTSAREHHDSEGATGQTPSVP